MEKQQKPRKLSGAPALADAPDRSPEGLRATAARMEERSAAGFFVPPSAVGVYAAAMRALAREEERG